MTIRTYCYVALGLLTLMSSAAIKADEPLKIGVFAPAGAVNRYLNTPENRQKVLATLKGLRVSKFFLEGNRADEYVPVELLREVRDDFKSKGIATSGGHRPLARQRSSASPRRWGTPAGSTIGRRRPSRTSRTCSARTRRCSTR